MNNPTDPYIALVTGATRGIGAAIAQELKAAGMTVIGTDLRRSARILRPSRVPGRAANPKPDETRPMAKAPTSAPKPDAPIELRYEDRLDLVETFADNVQRMSFDGRTMRIEFCVQRADEPDPKARQKTGRAVPVVRLVLDLEGAVDLFNKINSLQAAMQNLGVIKTEPRQG